MGKIKQKFMDFYRKLSISYNFILLGWIATGIFAFYVHGAFYQNPLEWKELIIEAMREINGKSFAALTVINFIWIKGLFFILTKSPFFREYYGQPNTGDYL